MSPRYHEFPIFLNRKHGKLLSNSNAVVLISRFLDGRSHAPARPSVLGSSTWPSMTNDARPHVNDCDSLEGGNGMPRPQASLTVLVSVFRVVSGGSVTSIR